MKVGGGLVWRVVYNMIQFKEVVFVRLRKDNSRTNTNYDSTQYKQKIDQTRGLIRKFINWSEYIQRHDIKQIFMNYENKAIYSNGIIIREFDNNHFEVELLTTVPRPTLATRATPYENQKNYVNYNSEFTLFHSNPYHLFDSLGYKILGKNENREVEYFKSYTFGVEVMIYPKNGYIQLVETYPITQNYEASNSVINAIIKEIKNNLDAQQEITISSSCMRPNDFAHEYS